jgi:tRNA threonylcarbamoyladenosine biosynthesis protein TsaE
MVHPAALELRTARTTRELGAAIAGVLASGDLVVLSGDLGAGKTFLARAIVRALGSTARVTSPTFTLVQEYEATSHPVLHADLYRLRATPEGLAAEVRALGLRERRGDGAVVLVEWGEEAVDALGGSPALVVSLAVDPDGRRTATLSGPKTALVVPG